jgi:hypothetical protein
VEEWKPMRHRTNVAIMHEVRDAGEDVSGPLVEFRLAGSSQSAGTMNKGMYERIYEEAPVGDNTAE